MQNRTMYWFMRSGTRIPGTHGMVRGWGNGYVALPPDHPFFGVDYDKIPVRIHCDLDYGEMNGTHWIVGFSTSHVGDTPEDWPRSRVRDETLSLFKQLKELESKNRIRRIIRKWLGWRLNDFS